VGCPAPRRDAAGDWQALFDRYRAAHPELAAELERRMAGELPTGWAAHPRWPAKRRRP
jgi:transketolase